MEQEFEVSRKNDQDYWRRVFVAGSMTLKELAKEQDAPTYGTVRKWAMATEDTPSWKDQRKQFRNNLEQKTANVPEVQATVNSINRIIDAAEMLAQHNMIAKALISKGATALSLIDPSTLKPAEIAQFLKMGIDVQRIIEGMATERSEMKVDLSQLSDADLEKLANGG